MALAHERHADDERVSKWYAGLTESDARIATCSITQLGFGRVSVHVGFETDVPGAVETLTGLKASSRIPFERLSDDLGADDLPAYVRGPKQITDGHLLALARTRGWSLISLDKGIPGTKRIP